MVTSSNRPSRKLAESAKKDFKIMQLKVELRGVRPKVWRRVLVPANIRLDRLHVILLRTMGWSGGHLHEFEFAEGIYGVPDPDCPNEIVVDESKVTLKKALGYSATFAWTYDLSDDWSHKVNVERVDTMPAELKLQFPVCLAGAGACPPEDVGGAPGYVNFLQAIADPEHLEHGDAIARLGCSFDPQTLNVKEVQERLYEIEL